MHRRISTAFLIVFGMILAGCAHEPKDLSGQTLSPVSVDQVQLYQKHPDKYDIVGTITVEITPDLKWDENGAADKAFDAMKAKAAAMGANGIMYDIKPEEYNIQATASYHGQYYRVPVKLQPTRTAVARAILVLPD